MNDPFDIIRSTRVARGLPPANRYKGTPDPGPINGLTFSSYVGWVIRVVIVLCFIAAIHTCTTA